ncbi:MAG: mechanosensitive ion channel family protein, partial [Polaromonas sp.]|nr:mechanosensitive ion channel family protein [Polaromonas sp.]
QLRLLVTSASSGRNWDLRCHVREGLVDFMQRDYPQHLPLLRAELGRVEDAKPFGPPAL